MRLTQQEAQNKYPDARFFCENIYITKECNIVNNSFAVSMSVSNVIIVLSILLFYHKEKPLARFILQAVWLVGLCGRI